METEKYICGYCRMLDASRIVEVVLDDTKVMETACCYGACVHQNSCSIASEIAELGQ